MSKRRHEMTRQFISTRDLAALVGQTVETIVHQCRRGEWPFALGGGKGRPYKFRKTLVEAKLNLDPGTL